MSGRVALRLRKPLLSRVRGSLAGRGQLKMDMVVVSDLDIHRESKGGVVKRVKEAICDAQIRPGQA